MMRRTVAVTHDLLFNRVDGRSMTFAGVGAQDVKEIGKLGHGNRLVGLLVAKVIPVLGSCTAISTYQLYVILRKRETSCKNLCSM